MKLTILILIIISSVVSVAQNSDYIVALLSDSSYSSNFTTLASDSLQGRGTGQHGGDLAAQILADKFAQIGLQTCGSNSYFQNIPMHSGKALPSSKFVLYGDSISTEMRLGSDYLVYKTGEQTFLPVETPMVFAGYGIIAPEYDYNDYQSIDVEGKIVVFLSGEPYSKEDSYFNGDEPTIYSYPEVKQRVALSRGAVGSIIIPNPRDVLERTWEYRLNQFAFEDVSLAYSPASSFSALMNPSSTQPLFDGSGRSLKEIFTDDIHNAVKSFPLKTRAAFRGEFAERDFIAKNVIGMIEGSDPKLKDTYIIVSAHYDHLGIGPEVSGDSIYNGAFDNAAGTAAVLELAKAFSKATVKPKRSIIFLLLTGEEKGLLGSSYYANNPVVPLYKTAANINIDGLSMFDEVNSFTGVGAELSTLEDYLGKAAAKINVNIGHIPPQFKQDESFSQSDQFSFAQAGIPAILVLEEPDYQHLTHDEGLKKLISWMENIYHTPFDDANQDINYDAVMQHLKLLAYFIYEVADSSKAPEWKKGSVFLNARLQSIAEKR